MIIGRNSIITFTQIYEASPVYTYYEKIVKSYIYLNKKCQYF